MRVDEPASAAPLNPDSMLPLLFSQHVSDLHVALGRLQYTKAKHASERSGWESSNAQTVLAFDDALRAIDREAEELKREVDYHHKTTRTELETSRDRAAAAAGCNAVLADLDRQCRLLDDVAESLQHAMLGRNRETLVANFSHLVRFFSPLSPPVPLRLCFANADPALRRRALRLAPPLGEGDERAQARDRRRLDDRWSAVARRARALRTVSGVGRFSPVANAISP